MRIRGLCKLPNGRDWLWRKLGLALVGRALLRKSLIQLSADRWGCAPSLLVVWPEMTQCWSPQSTGLLMTSRKDLCQHTPHRTAAASGPIPMAGHHPTPPPQETLICAQDPSLVGSLLLSSGSRPILEFKRRESLS